MIINTGQRTDIPAFYSKWFLKRLEEGFVCVRNPFNPRQVTRYRLDPDLVDIIGFCTKNPGPMLAHMDRLAPYGQFWYVTITCYGRDIEPRVPPVDQVIRDFKALSDVVGVDSIGWRYDPILITDHYTPARHLEEFRFMAEAMAGYTRLCVISFIDLYRKVLRNFPEAREVPLETKRYLGREIARIGRDCGMEIRSCHEGNILEEYGVNCSGCMTIPVYERAIHGRLRVPSVRSAREGCACYLSCDIGAYDSCPHLCRYCYANNRNHLVEWNYGHHDPDSPLLIGHLEEDDQIHEAVQESWLDRQMNIFDYFAGNEDSGI